MDKDDRIQWFDGLTACTVPYAGLVIGTVVTPVLLPTGPSYWLVTGPLVAASALWSAWFIRPYTLRGTRPTPPWPPADANARASRHGGLYVTGLLLLMAALCYQSPFFGFQAFAGYVHSAAFLRGRARVSALAATALLAAYAQFGGGHFTPTSGSLLRLAALAATNLAISGGLTYFGYLTAEQNQQRKQMIAELNEANRRLAESVAQNAELHTRLMAQARETGILDERSRLAREIHDTIAQGLAGVVTQLEAAAGAGGDRHQRHLETARSLARESLAEARRSVAALAPGPLADARLPDAIAELAKAWTTTTGVPAAAETSGEARPLLPELEVALLRVAQEALANVGKHADASRVGLTLTYMDDVVVLDVRDDGLGFDPSSRAGSGFGLDVMQQRVRRVSGTLTIESAPGEGTAVSASVPMILGGIE